MIGLMDCNNFFVSCERLFRPDLKRRPVAVLSSKDGCIVARSQEVKDIGVPMGAPYFQVKELCEKHRVVLFSSNFPLYRDISDRVMSALREEFGDISIYSIDEAFFEVPGHFVKENITMIRSRVIQKTGIPVSFGIAPTKTIAKLANNEAKKGDGVVFLTQVDARARYTDISAGAVWGIGREMTKKLDTLNVRTVEEFLQIPLRYIRQQFGVHGERLYLELTGTQVDGLEEIESPTGSIMSTRSFPRTIEDVLTLKSAIGYHVSHIAEKLRERRLVARSLTIVCAPSRHGAYALREGTKHIKLEKPTNDTQVLLGHAYTLFADLYEAHVPYKKAGALVSDLVPHEYVQESLFTPHTEHGNTKHVYDVVDSLNNRFGKNVVHSGAVLSQNTWAPSSDLRSKEYTTMWSQIPSVKAI